MKVLATNHIRTVDPQLWMCTAVHHMKISPPFYPSAFKSDTLQLLSLNLGITSINDINIQNAVYIAIPGK